MATVIHETPDGRTIIDTPTAADWLDAQGWPQGWHAFHGDRRLGPDDISLLNDPNATLRVVSVPMGFTPFEWIIVGVVAALTAGVAFALTGIEVPETATNRNASSANNELAGRSNKPAKIGQRIPDIWGLEPRAYPLLLSTNRRFDWAGREYEESYLLLGAGAYHSSSWKDGDTPVENITGTGLQIYGPGKSPYRTLSANYTPDTVIGEPIDRTLAPKIVRQSNEIDGVTVNAPNAQETSTTLLIMPDGWVEITDPAPGESLADLFDVGDSIRLRDCFGWEYVTNDLGFPQGEIYYYTRASLDDSYVITEKDTTRVRVTPGDQPGWPLIPVGGQYQATRAVLGYPITDTGPIIIPDAWFPKFPAGPMPVISDRVAIRSESYSPAGASAGTNIVGPITVTDCTGVIINLVARNGIYKLNGSTGEPENEVVEFEIAVRSPDGDTLTYAQVATNAINRRDATGSTAAVNWTTRGDATVTVTRITDTDKDYSGTVVDEVQWRDLYMIRQLPTNYNPGNVTTCLLSVQANSDASRVKDRKLNCRATRKLSDGQFADARFSSILPALHADPFNGRRNLSSIDTDTLNLISAQIAAESLAVRYPVEGRVCGYTFDDTNLSYEDELRLLCKAVNLRPYHIGGDISFVWEFKRDVDCLLTHKDIVPGSFKLQRSFTPSREFTGVELSYKNRARGEQLTVTAGPQEAPEAIELKGQHYEDMALYAANSQYARQRHQRISVELEAGQIVRRLAVGMRLQVEDCTRYKSVGGEIAAVAGLVLTTNQPVPDGVTAIWLARRNGDAYRVDCTKTGAKQVTLATGTVLPEPLYTDWQERRTRYLLWGATDSVKPLDLLVTEIDIKGGSSGVVRLVNYDERYHKWPI